MASTDMVVLLTWPLQTWWFYLHGHYKLWWFYLHNVLLEEVLKNGKKKNRNMYKLKKGPPSGGALNTKKPYSVQSLLDGSLLKSK